MSIVTGFGDILREYLNTPEKFVNRQDSIAVCPTAAWNPAPYSCLLQDIKQPLPASIVHDGSPIEPSLRPASCACRRGLFSITSGHGCETSRSRLYAGPPRYACAQLRICRSHRAFPVSWSCSGASGRMGFDYAIDDSLMDKADLIIFQRYFPMAETRPVVERALASGTPVIYECDDDFLHVSEGHPMRERLAGNVEHIEYLARRAHAMTTTTAELASRFPGAFAGRPRAAQPAGPHPVGAGHRTGPVRPVRPEHRRERHRVAPGRPGDRPPHPGARGAKVPGPVRLVFYGLLPRWAADLPGVESLPFDDDYVRYAKRLRRLDLDLALVPLADTVFNRCKSAIKYLEYAACGVPGVFSGVTPYTQAVEHGARGCWPVPIRRTGSRPWTNCCAIRKSGAPWPARPGSTWRTNSIWSGVAGSFPTLGK